MTDVKFEHPELFFKRLSTRAKELPIWVGELYFELHRGTFTTQSRLKYLNRVSEQALRTSECWSAISHIFGLNFTYPTKEFEKIWQAVLL
jgi:alpha-mannosidase